MAKHNVWMSVSDLMTGLMVIFLFIAISYMYRVQRDQTVLTEYVDTKEELHQKLIKVFEGDTLRWQIYTGEDLSMKFKNPAVLFAQGSYDLTPTFKTILDEFLPRYFDILLNVNDSLRSKISEVRIEGHTDPKQYPILDSDPYIANVILSQRRALSVLKYVRNMDDYKNYTDEQQRQLEFWFTANGLSYGRALDENGDFANLSKKEIDDDLSRRVEFRIVTKGDEVLEEFRKKLSERNHER